MSVPFDAWAAETDRLCTSHLLCDWKNLCGEPDVLERSYDCGETPMQFVRWWAVKCDLMWIDPDDPYAFYY